MLGNCATVVQKREQELSEAELHELLVGSREITQAVMAALITVNFSMIAGVYYFVSRSGIRTKIACVLLYLIAIGVLFVALMIERDVLIHVVETLEQMRANGERLTPVSEGLLDNPIAKWGTILMVFIWSLASMGMCYLIFFYKIQVPITFKPLADLKES